MEDIIIKLGEDEFQKKFIPEPGQKMFVQCPDCKTLHEIELGQGEVCPDNECTTCGEYLGDCCVTYELFETRDAFLMFYDEEYLKPFVNSRHTDINGQIELTMAMSKAVGEIYCETPWDVNDDSLMTIKEYLEDKDPDAIFFIIKEDINMFLHLKFNNVPLDNMYVIDKDWNVTKLNKINISVNVE